MLNRTLALGLGLIFAVGLTSLCAPPSRAVKSAIKAGPVYERHGPRLAEQKVDSVSTDRHERLVRDTVTMGEGTIAVENQKGSITVSTWERDEVAYRARIVSEEMEAPVEETRIDVARSDTSLSLATNYDEVEGQWTFGLKAFGYVKSEPEVHYTLRVPASAALRIIDHESDIGVSGLAGPLQIDTHEGALRVTDQRGRAEVSAHDGRMVLRDVSGNLVVDSHEGAVTIDGLRGRLDLQTHEGRAEVRIDALDEIVADTHEGALRVTDQRGRAEVSAHDGRMVLRDVSGNLVVDSHEGAVTIDGLRGRLNLQTHEGRAEVRIDALDEIVADTHEGTVLLSLPAASGFDLSTDFGDDADFQSDVDVSSARQEESEYQGAVRGGGPLVRLTSHEGRITLRSQ